MDITFLIFLGTAFIGFLAPALCYRFIVRNSSRFNSGQSPQKSAFLPFAVVVFALSVALYFIFYSTRDFLTSFSLVELAVPFAAAIIIYIISLSDKVSKFFPLFLLAGAAAGAAVLPENAATALLPFDPLYNRLIACIVWFIFSYIYRYANSGDAMLSIQSVTIAGGICILSFINAVPVLSGAIGLVFVVGFMALMSFTWHPSRLKISDNEASCFGFMIFAPCLWVATENAGSCVIIYSLYFIIDFIWALALKLSFVEKYDDIMQNTAYRQSVAEGAPAAAAAAFSVRAQILLIFLGSFQALADNQSSLLLISCLIIVWFLYKFRNIGETSASLRDINRQVIEDLQDRVNDIKQYINRDNDF